MLSGWKILVRARPDGRCEGPTTESDEHRASAELREPRTRDPQARAALISGRTRTVTAGESSNVAWVERVMRVTARRQDRTMPVSTGPGPLGTLLPDAPYGGQPFYPADWPPP